MSHLQATYGSGDDGRNEVQSQLTHLNSFIQAYSNPHRPTLLMGDLNTDSYNGSCVDESHPGIYEDMMNRLQHPRDLWAEEGLENSENPCIGVTSDSERAFSEGEGPKLPDDPSRRRRGERIDYFFSWQGSHYWPTYQNTEVVIWQFNPGWDISDHYGLWTNQVNLRELTINFDFPINTVSVALTRFHCLEETDEVGDDEVYFKPHFNTATGLEGEEQTGVTEHVDSGDIHIYDSPVTLTFRDPGEWLDITVKGWEEDDTSRDDSLGTTSIRLERRDLLELLARSNSLGHSTSRVLPLLTGDGGEYAMTVTVSVEPPVLPNELLADTTPIILDPENGVNSVTRVVYNDNPSNSITWNAEASETWLELTPISGNTPSEFTVTFNNPGLRQGTHMASITLTSPDLPDQSLTIPVEVKVPAYKLYLPLVDNNASPDLTVEEIVVSNTSVSVVIANEGTKPVTTPFWVDLYVNPDPIPSGVNQIWADGRSRHGLVWGITTDIPIDGTLTLTIDDPYYRASLSDWPSALSENTPIYVQVDSANIETTYGGVLELHEIVGTAYNNIMGPVYTTAGGSLLIPAPNTIDKTENTVDQLPVRLR